MVANGMDLNTFALLFFKNKVWLFLKPAIFDIANFGPFFLFSGLFYLTNRPSVLLFFEGMEYVPKQMLPYMAVILFIGSVYKQYQAIQKTRSEKNDKDAEAEIKEQEARKMKIENDAAEFELRVKMDEFNKQNKEL